MGTEIILSTFVAIGIVLSVITLHSAYLLTEVKGYTVVKWIYPVVAAACFLLAVDQVRDIQGYSLHEVPNGEFEYITHEMQGEIALLLVVEDGIPRFYTFTPNEEQKMGLEKAKKGKEQGQKMNVKISEHTTEAELVRMDVLHPKEG